MLTQGITLECRYADGGWAIAELAYGCDDVKITHVGDKRIVTEVSQNHPEGSSNSDVQGFTIHRDKSIEFFPRNLGGHFPNLLAIEVSGTSIDEISREDLVDLRKLKMLYLYGNRIAHIESNLFSGNPALVWISFSYNPIRSVGSDVFDKLKDLTELRFFKTTCITEEYSEARATDVPHMISKIAKNCQDKMETVLEELKKLNKQFESRISKLEQESKRPKL